MAGGGGTARFGAGGAYGAGAGDGVPRLVYGISGRECAGLCPGRTSTGGYRSPPLRSTDGIEFIRAIGTEWNEHTPTRTNVRNDTARRCSPRRSAN
jgi:hypothetical protein